MVKLLKGIVILFAAVFAAYFFLIDGVIKSQLEREGSRALQAPLEIGGVNFHLIPTSLTLRDVQVGNARLPTHNVAQAETLALPLSLRDLLAHKLIIDVVDIHGLRFNRPRSQQAATVPTTDTTSAIRSAQLHKVLQRVRQTLNNPLASNTIDPNASIAGALLADEFKPLLDQVIVALNTIAAPVANTGDWQILARHVNIDGALDFGASLNSNDNALRFVGTIDNVTPQPQLFDTVTQFDFHSVEGGSATLRASGSLDKRKLTQATMRFDLNGFPLTQWPLCDDPELKIVIVGASMNIQALLSLTGNQLDLNALTHFQQVRFDITNSDDEVARVAADVWRRTDAFDLNLQVSGDLHNPVLKLNSSIDAPLAAALRQIQLPQQQLQSPQQLQPPSALPQATPFSNSP